MSEKIGFWSVFAIVIGSQIGSGVLMLPASLAPFGEYSIGGWLISGLGAVCFALVFAGLCNRFPKTGGPHVYVHKAFGASAAFFVGWTYWVISWVSTAAVVIAGISYLSPFIGNQPPLVYLVFEIVLLIVITGLNLKGVQAAGRVEFMLTLLKVIPLFVLPLMALWSFNAGNMFVDTAVQVLPFSSKMAQVTLLTLWGFIGLETATTPADSVLNPSKTIPRAIVLGTICTALLYLISSVGIMGLVPGHILAASKAPYVDVSHYLFGGNWHVVVSIIASIVCIGSLNAWMLASGQIVLGLAQDKFMPNVFMKKNKNDVPVVGLVTSALGILPLLCFMMNATIADQITAIIDFSVVAFLFVYGMCVLAYMKVLYQEKAKAYHWIYTLTALLFCAWVISKTPLYVLAIASLFTLSGVPLYFWYCKQTKRLFVSNAESNLT